MRAISGAEVPAVRVNGRLRVWKEVTLNKEDRLDRERLLLCQDKMATRPLPPRGHITVYPLLLRLLFSKAHLGYRFNLEHHASPSFNNISRLLGWFNGVLAMNHPLSSDSCDSTSLPSNRIEGENGSGSNSCHKFVPNVAFEGLPIIWRKEGYY